MQHLERLLQVDWPELDVLRRPRSPSSGRRSRWPGRRRARVLAQLVDIDVSNDAFPFLAVGACAGARRGGTVAGAALPDQLFGRARLRDPRRRRSRARDVGSGDGGGRANSASCPTAPRRWARCASRRAMSSSAPEADGRTTADDLGLGELVSAGKWCVGKPLLGAPGAAGAGPLAARRPHRAGRRADAARRQDRRRSGPRAAEPDAGPRDLVVLEPATSTPGSRWRCSPDGRARHGETLWAVSPLAGAQARVTVGPPCFIDPDGERLRG